MHDFLCSDPDDMKTELMAERARYLKNNPEGVREMCKVMEDLREESIQREIDQTRIESIKTIKEYISLNNIDLSLIILEIGRDVRKDEFEKVGEFVNRLEAMLNLYI